MRSVVAPCMCQKAPSVDACLPAVKFAPFQTSIKQLQTDNCGNVESRVFAHWLLEWGTNPHLAEILQGHLGRASLVRGFVPSVPRVLMRSAHPRGRSAAAAIQFQLVSLEPAQTIRSPHGEKEVRRHGTSDVQKDCADSPT